MKRIQFYFAFYNSAFSKRIQKYQEIHSLNAKTFRLPLTYAFASVNMNSRNKFGFLSPLLLLLLFLPAPITRTKRSRTSRPAAYICVAFFFFAVALSKLEIQINAKYCEWTGTAKPLDDKMFGEADVAPNTSDLHDRKALKRLHGLAC